MARLTAPQRLTVMQRLALTVTRRMFGRTLEPSTLSAHHPRIFWTSLLYEARLMRMRYRLPTALRDLVLHRVAVVIGCPWCIDFGAMLALRAGLTTDRILAVPDYAGSPLFSPLEKRAMAFADAATATPPSVTDDQVAELRRDLGEAGVLELAFLVALENQRSRLNHVLGVTAQGFTDATVCALPELRASH